MDEAESAGSSMTITFKLELDDEKQTLLSSVIGCEKTELGKNLSQYGTAALEEYIGVFTGDNMFSTVTDINKYRLFLLIKHVFHDELPAEERIADLLHLTPSAARTLLRNTAAKYRRELDAATTASLKRTLSGLKEKKNEYRFSPPNAFIVEKMNALLAGADKALPPVTRVKDTISQYSIGPDSYKKLLDILTPTPPKDK
jgi:hypothetical protein